MLKSFIDFVDSILPSVSPDFRDGAKAAIKQFTETGKKFQFLNEKCLEQLSQGDILSELPFAYYDCKGKLQTFKAQGFVLSTSCNIDNKENINIVPLFSINALKGNERDVKSNQVFDYMYIPDEEFKEYYIDFSYVNTYSRDLIFDLIKSGKIIRKASLSMMGYYIFIVKLTVFYMRKEDSATLSSREKIEE